MYISLEFNLLIISLVFIVVINLADPVEPSYGKYNYNF